MTPRRPVLSFVAVFALAYGFLLLPALRLDAAHGAATRALWNGVAAACEIAGVTDVGVSTRFEAGPAGESSVRLRRAATGFDMRLAYRSRDVAYWPIALVVALALATPASLSRRLRAAALGGAIVQVLVGLSALACVADAFRRYDVAVAEGESSAVLAHLVDNVLLTPLFWISLSLGTWALVAFRCRDWLMTTPFCGVRAGSDSSSSLEPPATHGNKRLRPIHKGVLAS